MSVGHLEAQLAAGGLVPVKARVDPRAVEQVVARRYGGAPLGERVVVRLSAERLGPAEDLAMEFLGLRALGESSPIAQQQRRALGFASWALITHPENAKDALVLVKRIKAAGRKAKSKPGHAWDEFMAMANELNRSVKDFLPPFWEEAARIYKDLGNVAYAGRALSKALEAERVHALKVDRGRRRDAVLEFALGGCLSGKALAEYAKDLQNQFPPDEALETLRDLTIRRTTGGMPPIASAAKDLARLAQAAGKDPDAEVESMLQQVIASSAMSRAPLQFWLSVKKNVARIIKRDPAFAVWLLVHTDPQASYYSESPVWKWLELLDQWQVLDYLAKPAEELPPEVEIPGGRARWLGRLIGVESSPDKRVFEIVEKAAPAIRAEGQPIALEPGKGYRENQIDVDVLEQCFALGLQIADLPRRCELNFDGWLRADQDHPCRNSSLEHLLADERFRDRVLAAMPQLVQRKATQVEKQSYGRQLPVCRSFSAAASGHAAVEALWLQFLESEAERLEHGGLYDVEQTLSRLSGCVDRQTGERFPELTQRIGAVDMAAALQRTLIGGVLDEYGWAELDAADDQQRIPSFERRKACTFAHFPVLSVVRDDRVDVFSASGHEQRGSWPRKTTLELEDVLPVGSDTMLLYRDSAKDYNLRIAWLSDPETEYDTDKYYVYWSSTSLMQHGDGVFMGAHVLQPGDQKLPDSSPWFSDGERFWRPQESQNAYYWNSLDENAADEPPGGLQELDPLTGKLGRKSVPAWFETDLPPGSRIIWAQSMLMPAPVGLSSSPLGMRDGLLGWRVIRRRDGSYESSGIDGRACSLQPDPLQGSGIRVAVAMMDKPGTDGHWIITNTAELIDRQTGIGLATLEDRKDRYRFGQPLPLDTEFYHLMSVRCEASSKRLRQTTLEQARVLLQAGAVEHEARKRKEKPDQPDPQREAASAAVQQWLGQAPPRLVRGIARIARLAAEEATSLAKIQSRLSDDPQPQSAAAKAPRKQSEAVDAGLAELAFVWAGTQRRGLYGYRGLTSVSGSHLQAIARFFVDGEAPGASSGDPNWIGILADPAGAAWKKFWDAAHTGADEGMPLAERLNGPWLAALQFLADENWLDWPGELVFYRGEPLEKPAGPIAFNGRRSEKPTWLEENGCRYVIYPVTSYQVDERHALAYAPQGECKPPSTLTVIQTIPLQPTWTGEQTRAFVAAVRQLKELPLIEAGRLQAAAERLRVSPVQLALAWMGNYRSGGYGQEKLTKELRQHYGWKLTEIKPAVAALDADPKPLSLVSTGARLDPIGCVGTGKEQAFERMVEAWAEQLAKSVALPPQVLACFKQLRFSFSTIEAPLFISMLSDPDHCSAFVPQRAAFRMEDDEDARPEEEIGDWFRVLDRALWLVNDSLPFGDPARRKLPALALAVRRFIDNESTTLPFGRKRTIKFGDHELGIEETLAKFTGIGLEAEKDPAGHYRLSSDLIVGHCLPPDVQLYFRPARLSDENSWSRLVAAAALTYGWDGEGSRELQAAQAVARFRSDAMQGLIDLNQSDAIAEGAWDQDPRVSVPELVAEVSKRFKVSEEAATLYLQTLALHAPTTSNLQLWNGWTAAQLKQAADELVKQEHLITAKRSRAGRNFFLPGGWEPLKQPNLPIETWKLPLLGYQDADSLRGSWGDFLVCSRTAPDQFRAAWERVVSGDAPRYEAALST